ncbi:MAG: Abortive infection protein [Bacteroidetes bacterium]|nr:Abortive infection protein [Bacteroidota bacterium]
MSFRMSLYKKGNIISLVILALYVSANIFFMVLVPKVFSFIQINSSFLLCSFFIILNILLAFLAKLIPTLKEHWSILKLHHFLIGAIIWLIVLSISHCLKLAFCNIQASTPENGDTLSSGLGLTLVIISWEELMFRGIVLNFLLKYSSKLYLSIISGLLFMLIHLLNPEINILLQGPNLFFAGVLLTLLYLKFKSIWLPLGFHFANNIFSSKVELLTGYKLDAGGFLLSSGGYVDTLFLALSCFIAYQIKPND